LMNKQIADKVNVTEATVKLHRGQMMRKMEAASIPELVRMAGVLSSDGRGVDVADDSMGGS